MSIPSFQADQARSIFTDEIHGRKSFKPEIKGLLQQVNDTVTKAIISESVNHGNDSPYFGRSFWYFGGGSGGNRGSRDNNALIAIIGAIIVPVASFFAALSYVNYEKAIGENRTNDDTVRRINGEVMRADYRESRELDINHNVYKKIKETFIELSSFNTSKLNTAKFSLFTNISIGVCGVALLVGGLFASNFLVGFGVTTLVGVLSVKIAVWAYDPVRQSALKVYAALEEASVFDGGANEPRGYSRSPYNYVDEGYAYAS